ncbi:MAG: oxidoreductase [Planctomycetes bacterium]|nr:oxidoreductase [Planctomycetota bacterium]
MAGEISFLTLDPGHFHAALVQKEMYPEVSPRSRVFAPLGPDLLAHLERIAGFNRRTDRPTTWELDIHAGVDFARHAFSQPPGSVVILAGFNARKIDYIRQAVAAGMHVLADKPWIINPADLPKLQEALATAERSGLIAYDIMTERSEITSILQRALVNDPDVFGSAVAGTPEEPGVFMDSVHFLKKQVAGLPLRRPAWYFDIKQQGEGLSDVGTHLVDLAMWIAQPDQAITAARDVRILAARRWPTIVTRDDFRQITGQADFPDFLKSQLDGDCLPYFCNNRVTYTLCGIHVVLNVAWGLEAEPGAGDTHMASFRGTKSKIEIRQGKDENFKSELFVMPTSGADLRGALEKRIASWQAVHPGVTLATSKTGFHVVVPDRLRIGHEAHFAAVVRRFLRYVKKREPLPAWENPNMLAKYHVTTRGVEQASTSQP